MSTTNPVPENKQMTNKISYKFLISSLVITIILSVLIYWAPYFDSLYLLLEQITRDGVVFLLNLTGVFSESTPRNFPISPTWTQWGEASLNTPGVSIPNSEYIDYWIVKACTGMQAGAILISLILVTPIPQKIKKSGTFMESILGRSQLLFKFKIIIIFFLTLFIANVLRIWFHLYLVGALELPFSFAHDDLAKPIGFVGTLVFVWVIEKAGVPIIDTFADWMDMFFQILVSLKNKLVIRA
ncbi:MAG: hypothetical protein HeimC3_48810 [Candidatus Heimdallarchaeota archaeon LC_3]|nr:MAG: hypothetical protein HeimC3_48810 [Candidatus Heimdallarchaeota archaeon LC_3]